jgi:hypothetical protein
MGEARFYKDNPDRAREVISNVMTMPVAAAYAEQIIGQRLIADKPSRELSLGETALGVTKLTEVQGISPVGDSRRIVLARWALRRLQK